MCLQVYLATETDLSATVSGSVVAEPVAAQSSPLFGWLKRRYVYFVHGPQDCGCGFPHVIAAEFIDYFEGMFEDQEGREEDVSNSAGLLGLCAAALAAGGNPVVYPVWAGDEALPPKGAVGRSLGALQPETFLLTERFILEFT